MQTEVIEPAAAPETEVDFAGPADKFFDEQNKPPESEPAAPPKGDEPPAPKADDKGGNEKPAVAPNLEGLDEKTLADIRAGHIIPKHRFDEISNKSKELQSNLERYKSFGTPEDLSAKLAQLNKVPDKPAISMSDEDKALVEHIKSLVPELNELSTLKEIKEGLETLRSERMAERAAEQERIQTAQQKADNELFGKGIEKIKSLASANGIDVADETRLQIVCKGVNDILARKPELAKKFYDEGDVNVYDAVFKEYFDLVFGGFQRNVKAEILGGKKIESKLPRAPVRGGTPETDKPENPANMEWEEIGRRASSRLEG